MRHKTYTSHKISQHTTDSTRSIHSIHSKQRTHTTNNTHDKQREMSSGKGQREWQEAAYGTNNTDAALRLPSLNPPPVVYGSPVRAVNRPLTCGGVISAM